MPPSDDLRDSPALRQEGPQQDGFEEQLHEDAEHLFANLCEGDGEHSEALNVNLIKGAFRHVLKWAALSASRTAQAPQQDQMCEHGTAMDVHCCNCHSGFIFDRDHVCPSVDRLVGRLREVAFRETVTDVAEGEDPPEITWEELGEISTLLTEAANELAAAQARIQVLETSVDYLRYLVDHPVTQELWRPIETAKEDGEIVLVFDEGAMFRALIEKGRWIDIECDQPIVPPPSHWMPMPSPPSIAPPVAPAEGEQ